MLLYAQLEDAVIARIQQASDANTLGYRFKHVDSYGGEFDDESFFAQFRQFPAAWVTVGGDKPKRIGARSYLCAVKLAVMVGARNVRGERHTRRGAVGEPGVYQMLQDVRDLLDGQKLALPIRPLQLGAARTLFNTRLASGALAVFAAEFDTEFTYTAPEAAAPDLTAIGLNYYLKPGDDQVDAADLLTLAGQ